MIAAPRASHLFQQSFWLSQNNSSIKNDLARSCIKFWLQISEEGDKISKKKLARR